MRADVLPIKSKRLINSSTWNGDVFQNPHHFIAQRYIKMKPTKNKYIDLISDS